MICDNEESMMAAEKILQEHKDVDTIERDSWLTIAGEDNQGKIGKGDDVGD